MSGGAPVAVEAARAATSGGQRVGPTALGAADRVVLAYTAWVGLLVLLRRPPAWPLLVLAHAAVLVAVPALARAARLARRGSPWKLAHRWYPVALLLALYPEAGALRHLLVPHDLDPLVARWDGLLFPGRWWLELPPLLSPLLRETVHAAYLSYYLLLFLPALLAERRRPALVAEQVGVLTLAMLSHFAASFLFPVSGPLAWRPRLVPSRGLFTTAVEHAYRAFDRGGLAFPSTHAAAAVVAATYGTRLYPRARWLYLAWVLAIAASTVLGAFHYPVDSLAGLATGGLFAVVGRRWWRRAAPPWDGGVTDAESASYRAPGRRADRG